MIRKIKQIICYAFALAIVAASVLSVSAAEPVRTPRESVPWKALTFSASKWLNEIDTRIEISSVAAAEAAKAAVVSNQGKPLAASSPRIQQIEIATTINPTIGATVDLSKKFWFDSHRGRVLFGESQRTGQEEYLRRFRFTSQGVYRFRREPASGAEAPLASAHWSDVKASFYAYDLAKWTCQSVLEPSILIYMLNQLEFTSADPSMNFCVFHKRHLFRVNVRSKGVQAIEMDFTEVSEGKSVDRKETFKAHKLMMTATPLGDYGGEVQDFSFLGFKENIALYFDPVSRLPLMISGRIPTVGQAVMKLKKCELRD